MLKPTHINFGYSALFVSAIYLWIFSPVFLLLPFLAILADADHWQDSLSRKWLSLPWKHRSWSHSILWSFILWTIFYLLLIWIFYLTNNYWITSNNSITIWNFFQSWMYILLFVISILFSLWLLTKFINFKFITNILWWIGLFWYIIWLIYLYKLWYVELNYMLILIFIVSHIIWDYFTISWIPIFWWITKRKVRSLVYVKTWKIWEHVVNLLVTILNISLLFILFTKWYFNNINYTPTKTDIVLLIISWIIIWYFMSKELSFWFIKQQNREWISSLFNIIKYLSIFSLIAIWFWILTLYAIKYFNLHWNIEIFIFIIYWIIALIAWIINFKKIFKELLDVWQVFVYLLIVVFQILITLFITNLFFHIIK